MPLPEQDLKTTTCGKLKSWIFMLISMEANAILADLHCQNNFRLIDKPNEPKSSLFDRLKTWM